MWSIGAIKLSVHALLTSPAAKSVFLTPVTSLAFRKNCRLLQLGYPGWVSTVGLGKMHNFIIAVLSCLNIARKDNTVRVGGLPLVSCFKPEILLNW